MNVFEKNFIAAGRAYKRAVANSRYALRKGIPSTREGKQKQGQLDNKLQLATEALRVAANSLPDEKKRVGDVWEDPRGRHFRIAEFEEGGRMVIVSANTGAQTQVASDSVVPDNGWALVQAGDGEEEPS